MTFPCIKCKIHKYTITQIRKYTNTKCLKDPTCAIFLKSMGFKDIKCDIPVCQIHYIYKINTGTRDKKNKNSVSLKTFQD